MKLLYDLLFILGMLCSSIYVYILLRTKKREIPHYILSAFFLVLIVVLLESYAYIHQIKWLLYTSFAISYGTRLLIGPLLILYIQSLFLKDSVVIKRFKYYSIPYLLLTVLFSIPYAIGRLFEGVFKEHIAFMIGYSQYLRITLDLICILIIYQAFNVFFYFKKMMHCQYAYLSQNNFIWVRYILLSVLIIISLDLFMVIGQLGFNAFPIRSQNITMSLIAIALFIAGYYGLHQSKVLIPFFLLEDSHDAIKKTQQMPKSIPDKQLEIQLLTVMDKELPYLDEALTLNKLAAAIGTTDKKLSTLLNQQLHTSFYTFINSYRIHKFKADVIKPEYAHYSIEGLAYECGFKSKASFYRLFKKETGMSPSTYKKSMLLV